MRVLVVDDEPDVIEVVRLTFNLHWPEAEVPPAPTGSEGVKLVRRDPPESVILAARHEEVDKVRGLELGNGPARAPMIVSERGVGYESAIGACAATGRRREQAGKGAGYDE